MKLIQAIIALVGLTAATPVAYLPNVNNAVQPHDEPALGADSHIIERNFDRDNYAKKVFEWGGRAGCEEFCKFDPRHWRCHTPFPPQCFKQNNK